MPGLVQITTPPLSTQLTTLAVAKNDLNVPDYFADDGYITNLIDRASSVVASYCGRTFGQQTLIENYRNAGRNSNSYIQAVATYGTPLSSSAYNPLLVTYLPVLSITSITENGGSALATTDYEYDAGSGAIWRLYSGIRSAWLGTTTAVSYVAGYVLPNDAGTRTLPYVIEEVVLSLIRGAYAARGGDPRLVMEIVEGVGRNTYSQTAPMSSMEIDAVSAVMLAPYKRRIW